MTGNLPLFEGELGQLQSIKVVLNNLEKIEEMVALLSTFTTVLRNLIPSVQGDPKKLLVIC